MILFYLAVIEDHNNDDKFLALYNKYEKRVFSIAVGFVKDFHDAEDASQMAFFALARNIAKINLDNSDETKVYVYKAVKSACFDILRKKSRTVHTVSIDNFFDLSSDEDLENSVSSDEFLEKITNIIADIPEMYRDVLTYHYLAGFSTREISVLLNRPLSTVKSQLNRGNNILKKAIEETKIHDIK